MLFLLLCLGNDWSNRQWWTAKRKTIFPRCKLASSTLCVCLSTRYLRIWFHPSATCTMASTTTGRSGSCWLRTPKVRQVYSLATTVPPQIVINIYIFHARCTLFRLNCQFILLTFCLFLVCLGIHNSILEIAMYSFLYHHYQLMGFWPNKKNSFVRFAMPDHIYAYLYLTHSAVVSCCPAKVDTHSSVSHIHIKLCVYVNIPLLYVTRQ